MDDLSDIRESITEIKVTIAENATDLREHMRRTQLLENRQDEFTGIIQRATGAVQLVKVFVWACGAAATIVAAWKLFT